MRLISVFYNAICQRDINDKKTMIKKIYVLPVFIIWTTFSFAQIPKSLVVDRVFSTWEMPNVPGGAVGVIKDGQLVYAKGYGLADLEHDLPITPSSVFYIGSVSKQFVAFSILLLEEQGRLNLEDEIQKYLPDFPVYETPLTIRNFIHHTSGVRDFIELMKLQGRSYLDHIDEHEVYELIKQQKVLNFSPGEQYLYSNSCYFMLAMIIEKVTGTSLKKYASENIFKPLGMHNTLFYDDNTNIIKNRVFSYKKEERGFDNLIMRFDLVGSGGIYSNIEDLYLWDQNFYHNKLGNGGQTIIQKMHEEGLLYNGKSSGYAFALKNRTYRGLKTVSHGGSLAGYRSQFMRFPKQHFSVIILANRNDAKPSEKANQVADIYLKDEFLDRKNDLRKGVSANNNSNIPFDNKFYSQEELKNFVGTYYSDELQVIYNLDRRENNLVMYIKGKEIVVMQAIKKNIFSNDDFGVFEFKEDSSGNMESFKLMTGRVKNLKFIKEQ